MRLTFLYTLGLVATSIAVPGGYEPAGDLQPKLIPKANKRQVSVVEGLQSREIGGGFIAVIPKDSSVPAEGDDGSSTRRRRILRDEVVVPETLQDHADKRAVYYCKNSGYGLCPGNRYCCPIGGLCCSDGGCCKKGQRCCKFDGCCPSTHNCVIVDGQEGCCPIGKVCTATGGNECADAGYVPCSNYNFCCKPGYTCYRDSLGTNLCRAPTYDNYTTTTKRTTTTTAAVYKPTTVQLPEDTTTTDIQAQQVTTTTTPPAFAFPTTTPTPAANSTSSAPRTSSSVDIPIGAQANAALAVTSGVGCSTLLVALVFALSHALVLA